VSLAHALVPSPCGGVAIEIGGVEALLRPSGAVWIAKERLLVAADLHLEKGSAYAARGQMLPPYDTADTLARLTAEAAQLGPRTIVLLGDTLHDGGAEARLAPAAVDALKALGRVAELLWVLGNHDADGPAALPGRRAPAYAIAGLELVHEPRPGPQQGEMAGHLHPCARVAGRAGSVRRRCFVTDGGRLVLPALGAYAGGLNVLHPAFGGLFRRPPVAIVLGRGRAHAVGWRQLVDDQRA